MIKNENYVRICLVIQMNFKDIQNLKNSLNIDVIKAEKHELIKLKNKLKTLKDTRVKKKCTWDALNT